MMSDLPTGVPPTESPEALPAVHLGPSSRALRAMAIFRWMLLAGAGLLAFGSFWIWGPLRRETTLQQGKQYFCPMHPEVHSSRPGHCPICHMDLEEQKQEAAPSLGKGALSQLATVQLTETQARLAALGLEKVHRGELRARLRLPASLVAPDSGKSQVRVRAPGFVEEVFVKETGKKVSAGQALAKIYSPELYRAQSEYLAARKLGAAPELLTESRKALSLLGVSEADLLALEEAGKPSRSLALRAPASGVVTSFAAYLGSRAEPETLLYELSDLSQLWVLASLHEGDSLQLSPGQEAELTLFLQEAPLRVKLDLVEPSLDAGTRTYKLRFLLDNRQGKYLPGAYGELALERPLSEGLRVSQQAVIRRGRVNYVYVQTEPRVYEPREVSLGSELEGEQEIRSGLKEGELVVSRGSFLLDSESRLRASLAGAP